MARNRLILALSISWLSCATYVVVTSDFFQASRKGKAQKHMAEVGLNNEPTLSLITQLMGHISCVVSTVPVCNDNQQRYTLIVVTIKVPAGHCNCLAHGRVEKMDDGTVLSLWIHIIWKRFPQSQKTYAFHCHTGVNLVTWTNIIQHSFKNGIPLIQMFSFFLAKVFIFQEPYKKKHLSKLVIIKTKLSKIIFPITKENIYSWRLKCSGSIKIISLLSVLEVCFH